MPKSLADVRVVARRVRPFAASIGAALGALAAAAALSSVCAQGALNLNSCRESRPTASIGELKPHAVPITGTADRRGTASGFIDGVGVER